MTLARPDSLNKTDVATNEKRPTQKIKSQSRFDLRYFKSTLLGVSLYMARNIHRQTMNAEIEILVLISSNFGINNQIEKAAMMTTHNSIMTRFNSFLSTRFAGSFF